MNKIFNFFKVNLAILLMVSAWIIVTIFNLRIYWMLVDDGWDVVFSRTLFEKISKFNFAGFFSQLVILENEGRFRPVYWFYQTTVWIIGKDSPQFQHFAHMLVIGLTVFVIYLIMNELTRSKLVSFFGSISYLLIPTNTENIFRLGPQEPLLVLFLSLIFYLLISNKKVFLSCLILVLCIFTKETSVAILPVLFLYYFLGKNQKFIKNKKQGFYLWFFVCISSMLLILVTSLTRSGYATNYYFSLPMILYNLTIYLKALSKDTLFVFPIFFMIFCLRITLGLFKKKNILPTKLDFFEFLFSLGFICFLLIQLPWKYPIPRYLMPGVFFVIIFLYLEIYRDIILLTKINLIKNNKRILLVSLIIVATCICFLWGFQLISKEASSVSYYEAFNKMAGYPINTTILINTPKGENSYEIQIQLSEFWNRTDLKVGCLDLQNLPEGNYVVVDADQLLRNYPHNKLNSLFQNEPETIKNFSRVLLITTPSDLIEQSIKKLADYLINRKPFTSTVLYTYYYNYNNWYFYRE